MTTSGLVDGQANSIDGTDVPMVPAVVVCRSCEGRGWKIVTSRRGLSDETPLMLPRGECLDCGGAGSLIA